MAVASNIRHLMENYTEGYKRGISSRELAKKIAVSYKTIDRAKQPYSETGPNLDTLDEIAAFFKLQTWQLLLPAHHETTGPNNHQKHSDIQAKG